MIGPGFLIWQLADMPPVQQVIDILRQIGAGWVSIKIADGKFPFNQLGGNDQVLLAFINELKAAGFEVGGWQYVYFTEPGPQGDRAEERRQKLGLKHLLVDVEGEWIVPYGGPNAAKLYMSKLKKNGFDVGLCSFRFPTQQGYPDKVPSLPFAAFLNHENMDKAVPQVYWAGAHNPVEQTQRSAAEYAVINPTRPFVPIGATFGAVFDGQYWEPTPEDLAAFSAHCVAQYSAFGFYSLDWIFNEGRQDWLDAIASVTNPTPPPPPPVTSGLRFVVDLPPGSTKLNVRSGPGTSYPVIGQLPNGAVVTAGNAGGPDAWIEIEPGRWACVGRNGQTYMVKE